MLNIYFKKGRVEAGCDEAGRGPLAGPVVAAAVILPEYYYNNELNDSKQLTEIQRNRIKEDIKTNALAWAIASIDADEIDRINILKASTHAMCLAVMALMGKTHKNLIYGGKSLFIVKPQFLLIDGNRFYNETSIPYQCFVKGDARFSSIAAASILAKTYRDEIMVQLHNDYPQYGWNHNKGYPTQEHYDAIEKYGITPLHRKSFKLYKQHSLFDN